VAEIRRTEAVYGLEPKRLLEHGYGRLDTLLADLPRAEVSSDPTTPNVLVAPSWGESSIVAHGLERLIELLLEAGFAVTLRLHPMTWRHHPKLTDGLVARHSSGGRFRIDRHINTTDTLIAADVMISEWSGAALEYAFARERPVIFLDTPPKIHNPHYQRVGMPCLEESIREQIGRVVSMEDLRGVPEAVRMLIADAPSWAQRIRDLRGEVVFNVGHSGDVAARHILDTLTHVGETA
jgi:YidC/Oxa1 family membrane protein insertase